MSDMTPHDRQLEDQAETLDLINTEVTASLTQQADESAKLDTKALTLVGYIGVLSAFLSTRQAETGIAFAAYTAYATAAILDITVFMLSPGLRMAATPKDLYDDYSNKSRVRTLAALTKARVAAFEENREKLLRKAKFAQFSVIFLVAGVALMAISIALGSLNSS